MSWKPCRNSGVTFDRYTTKAEKYLRELNNILPECNPPKFEQINQLSKLFYLYFLNDTKAARTLGIKSRKTFDQYCPAYFIRIFKNNRNLIYKPLTKII